MTRKRGAWCGPKRGDEFIDGDAKLRSPRHVPEAPTWDAPARACWPSRKGAQWRADKGLGALEPAIEENGADQRLDHVADDIVAQVGMVLARLLAEADVAREVERAADLGAGLARHQRIVAAAHLALGLAREPLVEPAGDDQAEHAIAEEFEPLIGVAAVAAVGQRALEQLGFAGLAAERFARRKAASSLMDDSRCRCGRSRSALNQLNGLIQDALPSVDQKASSARPTTRSIGTKPMPPASTAVAAVEAVVAIVAHHEQIALQAP